MSGRKRATLSLSAEDRKRLESIQERLKEVEQDYTEARRRLEALRLEELQRSQNELEERQEHFARALHSTNLESAAQVVQLETQLNQAVYENSLVWQAQLEQTQQAAWQQADRQTQALLDEQAGAFRLLLDEQDRSFQALWALAQQERQEYFAAQRQQAQRQLSARQRKAWLAQRACEEAEALWWALADSYDHRRLAPGALDALKEQLAAARFNLQSELYEAALVAAQQAQHALSGLRLQMEQILARRAALAVEALTQAQFLCDFAAACAAVPAVDLDGRELDVTLDVNLWTDHRQESLARDAENLYAALEQQAGRLDEEQWLSVLQGQLPQLEEQLRQTVGEARRNVIASEVRFNVAHQVVEALSEQGFVLDEDAGYQEDDLRQPYQAILTSLDGSEVHVRVLAESQDPLNYVLDIDSCDQEQRSEHELRHRTTEVLGSLQAAGLQVTGLYQAAPGSPPPARRRLRERAPSPYLQE